MSGYRGVDLDGTIAHYDGWKDDGHIGDPVPIMVNRVKKWLANKEEVRIVTARAFGRGSETSIKNIKAWCLKHFGQELAVQCHKDFGMIELWDDRAVTVEINTGRVLGSNNHADTA